MHKYVFPILLYGLGTGFALRAGLKAQERGNTLMMDRSTYILVGALSAGAAIGADASFQGHKKTLFTFRGLDIGLDVGTIIHNNGLKRPIVGRH